MVLEYYSCSTGYRCDVLELFDSHLNYAYQRRTTVTEFSKIFLVFYKWLNLTDVQVIVHSKVCLVIFVCCEHAP